jgi:hypothetical protein
VEDGKNCAWWVGLKDLVVLRSEPELLEAWLLGSVERHWVWPCQESGSLSLGL